MTRHGTRMTIDDAEHYTREQRAAIGASYPAHEREVRAEWIPMLGSSRVFPVDEDAIKMPAFEIRTGCVQPQRRGWRKTGTPA
ncbi:terminase family protein [Rhizorhabdus dicambivorans]|uniref:terminase family protein n=1 Tax=Rhizorhabdus dicambivorans TaxID=1850238 RepID=UPI0008347064|nr:terminase family protein [Rhizorhabdus dicambivorans]